MTPLGGNSAKQLQTYLERAERLEEEIKSLKGDLKDLYGEAKGEGFDVKIMKAIVKFRAKGLRGALKERDEAHDVLDTYLAALGWLPGGADDNDTLTTIAVDIFANDDAAGATPAETV